MNALGVVGLDLSDDLEAARRVIRRTADQHGLTVADTRPARRYAMNSEAEHVASTLEFRLGTPGAVVVANFAQVESFAHTLTELCDLVTPEEVYRRGHCWTSACRQQR